jgi:hypothetical protein
MLTTDPLYWKPFEPKIEIKNLGNTTTYYTFDAFADITTNKVVYCRVDLGVDHHGTFEIQIENSAQTLDTTNIKKGQRVIISVKKDSTLAYTRLLSGLIRKTGYSRGIGGQALYNISGSTTAIRLNERVLRFVKTAARFVDGSINMSDSNMIADNLLQIGFTSTTNYPLGKDTEQSLGIINGSGIVTASDVENFIADVNIEYGELQDLVSLIEEQSGGEVFVDVNDLVQFRHQLQPISNNGKGFILKDMVGTADDADITCYYDGSPEYWESAFKSDSYSNRIYSILPGEAEPTAADSVAYSTATDMSIAYVAQKFRPQSHKPNIILALQSTGVPLAGIFGWINADVAGVPGGFSQTTFFSHIETYGTTTALVKMDNVQHLEGLDTTKDYWFIVGKQGTGANHYSWMRNPTTPPTTATANALGGPWTVSTSNPACGFWLPRRTQAYECSDYKSRSEVGLIESPLINTSATIKTKEALYKYMPNQLYYMARPQVSWSTFRVSVPNLPVLPNDPLIIVDSTLLFSTAGRQAVTATTGAMSYEFGSRGGIGNSIQSSLYLNITPVGFATHY